MMKGAQMDQRVVLEMASKINSGLKPILRQLCNMLKALILGILMCSRRFQNLMMEDEIPQLLLRVSALSL